MKEKIKFEIKRILNEHYNIIANKIEKNEKSTDGNVYMIFTNESKYVVKIYNDINHTNSIAKLHDFLSSHGVSAPFIIRNFNKKLYTKLNNEYMVVFSFMEGKNITWDKENAKLEDNTIKHIAKALKKLHDVTTNNNIFNLPKLSFGRNLERNSVLHFDLTRNNFFINDNMDNKVGFIDFDDAKYGPSVCDVAIIIANLFFSKTHGVDIEGTKKFINEYYYNESELRSKEVHLIKEFALKWIDYILNENEFDTSTTDSFVIRRKLIEKYLLI